MLADRTFRASEVCEATGVKPVTLRQWHLRGVFEMKSEGDGKWREYTLFDAVRIAIIANLLKLGITVERASMIALRCHVENSLTWPKPRIIEGGVVVQEGGLEERPVEFDSFSVFLMPEEAPEESDLPELGLQGLLEFEFDMTHRTAIGAEQLGSKFQEHLYSSGGYYSLESGIVINVSATARRLRARLREITENR